MREVYLVLGALGIYVGAVMVGEVLGKGLLRIIRR